MCVCLCVCVCVCVCVFVCACASVCSFKCRWCWSVHTGDELTVCYDSELMVMPVRARRERIQSVWGFSCRCQRCVDDEVDGGDGEAGLHAASTGGDVEPPSDDALPDQCNMSSKRQRTADESMIAQAACSSDAVMSLPVPSPSSSSSAAAAAAAAAVSSSSSSHSAPLPWQLYLQREHLLQAAVLAHPRPPRAVAPASLESAQQTAAVTYDPAISRHADAPVGPAGCPNGTCGLDTMLLAHIKDNHRLLPSLHPAKVPWIMAYVEHRRACSTSRDETVVSDDAGAGCVTASVTLQPSSDVQAARHTVDDRLHEADQDWQHVLMLYHNPPWRCGGCMD